MELTKLQGMGCIKLFLLIWELDEEKIFIHGKYRNYYINIWTFSAYTLEVELTGVTYFWPFTIRLRGAFIIWTKALLHEFDQRHLSNLHIFMRRWRIRRPNYSFMMYFHYSHYPDTAASSQLSNNKAAMLFSAEHVYQCLRFTTEPKATTVYKEMKTTRMTFRRCRYINEAKSNNSIKLY